MSEENHAMARKGKGSLRDRAATWVGKIASPALLPIMALLLAILASREPPLVVLALPRSNPQPAMDGVPSHVGYTASVEGSVIDQETDIPVAGVQVTIQGWGVWICTQKVELGSTVIKLTSSGKCEMIRGDGSITI